MTNVNGCQDLTLLEEVKTSHRDDGQGGGKLKQVSILWQRVQRFGPGFGYYPNPSKSILIVKEDKEDAANTLFKDSKVKITKEGHRDLGAFIGTQLATSGFFADKTQSWIRQINLLAEIAKTQPHAAHAGYFHGLRSKWVFLQRVMVPIGSELESVEKAINEQLIPAILGKDSAVSELYRNLFALPGRFSGLGFDNPTKTAAHHFRSSQIISKQHVELILSNQRELKLDMGKQKLLKEQLKEEREAALESEYQKIYIAADTPLAHAMKLAKQKGASALVTTLPLERYGFIFQNKRDYRDLLCLRYHLHVPDLPPTCDCGKPYSIAHSQQCLTGGFVHARHNEVQKLFAHECSKGGFTDIELEPPLLPIEDEKIDSKRAKLMDGALSDVRVRGFWGNKQNAFFEFRVFSPFASSYSNMTPAECYSRFESTRSAEYEQRINKVDCGNFTPMVMSSSGGMGPRMSMALKQLSARIAEKTNQRLSITFALLRSRFVFCLLRSALICLRGSRSISRPRSPASYEAPADLAASELKLRI